MLGAEEMEVKTKEWLKGAIRRIKKEEPVYVKKDKYRPSNYYISFLRN